MRPKIEWEEINLRVTRARKVELQIEAWAENLSLTEYLRQVLAKRGKAERCAPS